MNPKLSFILLFILGIGACKDQHATTQKTDTKAVVQPNNMVAKDAVITISHSPCYGRCPAYTMTLFANGKARFEGQRFVTKVGIYEKDLGKQVVNDLAEQFEKAGVWSMKDSYPSKAVDLPGTNISFNHTGKTKSIKGIDDAPQNLKDIVKSLNDIGDSDDGWKKVGDLPGNN